MKREESLVPAQQMAAMTIVNRGRPRHRGSEHVKASTSRMSASGIISSARSALQGPCSELGSLLNRNLSRRVHSVTTCDLCATAGPCTEIPTHQLFVLPFSPCSPQPCQDTIFSERLVLAALLLLNWLPCLQTERHR